MFTFLSAFCYHKLKVNIHWKKGAIKTSQLINENKEEDNKLTAIRTNSEIAPRCSGAIGKWIIDNEART